MEIIETIQTKPKNNVEILDEDACWRIVCEHLICSRFNHRIIIPILEKKFIIEQVNCNTNISQYELWINVLDFLSNIRYFGNTFNELKEKYIIKNK